MSLHVVRPPERLKENEIVSFDFDEENHRYLINGERWPSVTQILEHVGITNYAQFAGTGTGEGKRQYYLQRGTAVHIALAMWCRGRRSEVKAYMQQVPEWSGYIRAGLAFLEESGFEPLLIEQMLINPSDRYTGKLDLTGRIGKRFVIPDWKLTRARPATAIQTIAYKKALPYLGRLPPLGVAYPYADEDHERLAIPLLKDGRFGPLAWYDDIDDAGIWEAALACFYWRANHP